MNSLHVASFLRFAFSVAFGAIAFRAVADSPAPQPPLDLTAANLASVVDPLMAEWIAPAFVVSTAVVVLTLLAWPVAALWRLWRKKKWSQDSGDRRKYLAVRLVLLIDAVAIVATAALFIMGANDPRIRNDALDPLLLVLYAVAWLGVFGAFPALRAATLFWRNGVGSLWSRVHHSLIAASSVMIAWFFLTFHIAGTTLTY
jgi:hypothetical protein